MKRPTRPGTPNALSGRGTTINMDQRNRDRLTWLRHVAKRRLKVDAHGSVLVRAALAHFTRHIEQLLQGGDAEQRALEVHRLKVAARGQIEPLDEDALLAVPVRPFSAIEQAAHEARMERGRERIQEFLKQPYRHPNE